MCTPLLGCLTLSKPAVVARPLKYLALFSRCLADLLSAALAARLWDDIAAAIMRASPLWPQPTAAPLECD